jgi:hypothetical protein
LTTDVSTISMSVGSMTVMATIHLFIATYVSFGIN